MVAGARAVGGTEGISAIGPDVAFVDLAQRSASGVVDDDLLCASGDCIGDIEASFGESAVATGAGAQWHIAIHHVVCDESGLEAGL
jgi:hypothetical protein